MADEPPSDDTVQVLKLQHPPLQVERLLDGLVAQAGLVPQGAERIRDPALMPKASRRLAKLAAMSGRAWSCWADRLPRTWLVTGYLLIPETRERGAPVIQVDVYDEASPIYSGLWMIDRDEKWSRCAD